MSAGAAAAAARMRREEEQICGYSDSQLEEGYEFKILRSATGSFRKRDHMQKAVDEERANGWVPLEKFDNHRLRFHRKRPQGAPAHAGIDPYRTEFGMSAAKFGALVMAGVPGFTILMILVISISTKRPKVYHERYPNTKTHEGLPAEFQTRER